MAARSTYSIAVAVTFALVAMCAAASVAWADTFRQVTKKDEFVQLVQGRTLKYPGVSLTVSAQGGIAGRGLGIPVSGQWEWDGGYFCRDLFWGERDLGPNCQAVLRNGNVLRFISDQGSGQFADFRLR